MRYPVAPLAVALVLSLVLGAGCRQPSQGDDDPATDAGPTGDADPGVGCTPLSPRSFAPEAFVGPTGLQSRLNSLIDSAQQSLDVAMYLFTVTGIADRIIAAHDRGVAVRVLLDPDHEGNATVRTRLTSNGVPTRNAPNIYTFSHAKYMIVDGTEAVIMSMNFNVDAMDRERNYGIVDRDPDDVADVKAVFEQDWAQGGGEQATAADLACTRLVVSPTNSKPRLLALIDGATQTLDVEALYVSEDDIRAAIGAAKQRGVAVRVIIEATADNAETISYFRSVGIEVRDNPPFYNHAKLVIADGVAFVGSENFSLTALTRNREMGALVFEPTSASVIRQQFESDWSTSQ